MRHARSDYDAIQPWPTQRPHTVRWDGEIVYGAQPYRGDPPYEPLIPDDEPVFLLRAQDALAPSVVDHWADLLEREGGDPEMVATARRWANEMAAYGQAHGVKVPDAPDSVLG